MKARLNRALSEAAESDRANEALHAQLVRLEDASISTISAFCLSLLRRYSALLALSPDFSVADDAELELSLALDAVLEDFYKTAEEAEKSLLYEWYGGENDALLCEILRALYGFSRNLPDARASFFRMARGLRKSREKASPDEKAVFRP